MDASRVSRVLRNDPRSAEKVGYRANAAARRLRSGRTMTLGLLLTRDEIRRLADGLGDVRQTLINADPADKAEVYRRLGLHLVSHPGIRTELRTSLRGAPAQRHAGSL